MRFSSFRSLMMAAVLPLGLTACGPEIDQNILQVCDARAPRGSDAHDQCVSDFESGAEVQQLLVIRDPDPNGVQAQVVIRDSQGKTPWDVAPQLVIRDSQGKTPWDVAPQVIIRDGDRNLLPWDVAPQVVIRDRDVK
jgi:hypothetical protein